MPGKSAVNASTEEMELWDKKFLPGKDETKRQADKEHSPLLPDQKCVNEEVLEKVLQQQPQDTEEDVLAAQAKAGYLPFARMLSRVAAVQTSGFWHSS